jgi:SAM-dependent methyltransferase
MLPDLAAHAIEALTLPGQIVLDPMCGAGTTLVEALHLGRHAVGVDVEPRWASLARDNIDHTHRTGVGGHAHVITADARALPDVLPAPYRDQLTGRVGLVLTSPPYGASTHGQVSARPGQGVTKSDHRYAPAARAANLAYLPLHRLLAGLTRILRGCVPLLAPEGYVAITTRPWRQHGELIDLPGAVTHAALHAGLVPVQRCVALLCGIRGDGELISRASFFQRLAVTRARDAGQPWHVVAHEDLLLFAPPRNSWSTAARGALSPTIGIPELGSAPANPTASAATGELATTGATTTETGAA